MKTLREVAIQYKPGRISLTQGQEAIVDEDIYPQLLKFKWCADKKCKTYYASTNKNGKQIYMHRLILGNPKGMIVDHINHNGLDNRMSNIRICSHSQNKMNIENYGNNTSGHRGVCWDKSRNKWRVGIKFMNKLLNLGRFNTKKEAIQSYQNKARELFGEFVCFPQLNLQEVKQMEETNTQISEDWRTEVSDSAGATLKILDGETKKLVFLDEGEKRIHQDYGTSIVFKVEHEMEVEDDEGKKEMKILEMNFYVKENNYSLLKQLKEIGKLTGTPAKISRVGSKKSDTRYTVEVIEF